MNSAVSTGINIQNIIDLINCSVTLVLIMAVGFTIVGAISVWKAPLDGSWAFFRMFERLQVLQMITVMLVIASATILGLIGVMDSNGVTGILSGVAGYVLGGLNHQTPVEPDNLQKEQISNTKSP